MLLLKIMEENNNNNNSKNNNSNNSISNSSEVTEENEEGASSTNNDKGGDGNDSPAFRLRPRRSTPRSNSGSAKKLSSGSLIFSRLRSQQHQTPATRPTSSAKRNLFSSNELTGGADDNDELDTHNGETDNINKRTDLKRDIIDSITTDVLISPFMQRISVVDLKPNLKYEHNYITLQVKEVITNQAGSLTRVETQDKDVSTSNNNQIVKQRQSTSTCSPTDICSSQKEDNSDASKECSNNSLLRLICIEPKHLFDSSFSDDGDISVGSNDTIASNSSTTRRTSTRKKRRVGKLLSPYESPEPYLSRDKLIGDTLNRQLSNPMPMIVQLCGEYAKCPVKAGKLINIAKFKTVMTSETDIKSIKSHDDMVVTSAKVKSEDASQLSPKNIIVTYKGTTYTCLPYHVEVKAEQLNIEDTEDSEQSCIENLKSKDLTGNKSSCSWVPFVSITTSIDKPTDPLVEISSTCLDKRNTDRELQQQKESSNHGRNQNGSNFATHSELSQGESSDTSADETRHKKFFYNTHNTLKQASESPDMKILLKPSSSN